MEQELKQKQIEEIAIQEMARIFIKASCKGSECEKCLFIDSVEEAKETCVCLKAFYKAGYRKIPENAVVLTREEYEEYLVYKIMGEQVKGWYDREKKLEKQVRELDKELNLAKSVLSYGDERPLEKWAEHLRKETAEKFAEKTNQVINAYRKKVGEDEYVVDARRLIFEVNETLKEITGE